MRLSRHPTRGHGLVAPALLVAFSVCLACGGGGVRGEYRSADGGVFNFKSNGKVEVTMPAMFGMKMPTQEMDYAVEDGKILMGPSTEPRVVMPIDDKGCFVYGTEGFIGGKMCKAGSADSKSGT